MDKVFLVSFPRSGQHYTQRLIERVTGQDDYCELYHCRDEACPGKALPVAQRSPCSAGRRIQKTHDFGLDFPVRPDSRYAVFLRRPLFSLTSYFEHSVKSKPERHTAENWSAFALERAAYWRGFALRWGSMNGGNIRLFDYDALTTNADEMHRLCEFVIGEYDRQRLAWLAGKQAEFVANGKAGGRSLEAFAHPIDVAAIRQAIGPEALDLAGYADIL